MPNYFPVGYQPAQIVYQQPQYQPPMMQNQQMQQAQMQQPQQAQNYQQGGFVRVQSENEARMYPVAPGNSVTFIDENAPYCYTKTMDISQLDRPKFEKYRLVKEEEPPVTPVSASVSDVKQADGKVIDYATKTDISEIWDEIDTIKKKLTESAKRPARAKKEAEDDE